MRYDKRCTLIKVETIETPLGLEETETRITKPCMVQNVSFDEQTTLYGQTVNSALKLHFRGLIESQDRVEYNGKTYNVANFRYFRNATVFYVEGDSHR